MVDTMKIDVAGGVEVSKRLAKKVAENSNIGPNNPLSAFARLKRRSLLQMFVEFAINEPGMIDKFVSCLETDQGMIETEHAFDDGIFGFEDDDQ